LKSYLKIPLLVKYSSFVKFRNRWQDTDRAVNLLLSRLLFFKKIKKIKKIGDTCAAFNFSGKTDYNQIFNGIR
jgi:hypothetical protein